MMTDHEKSKILSEKLEELFCIKEDTRYRLRLIKDECRHCDNFVPITMDTDGGKIMTCKSNDVCYDGLEEINKITPIRFDSKSVLVKGVDN